ncbi:MAG: hypothetical protein IJ737_02175 [Ruminococcus sp.]|nr:hypothetical protein [Ruminococcus sp.]
MELSATLSSSGEFTSFCYGGINIRFRTSPYLERYTKILEWDNGYIVTMARYAGKEVEEYIDLVPILKNLYFDPNEFLKPIKEVKISYARPEENS